MTIGQAILDTDTLSAILRQNPNVLANARQYLAEQKKFTFSIITRYEVLRGLKSKTATAQITAFERFCVSNTILALTDEVVIRAADIYADLRRRGLPIGDADILIAASALVCELPLITNNENHFRRIQGLQVLNWLR